MSRPVSIMLTGSQAFVGPSRLSMPNSRSSVTVAFTAVVFYLFGIALFPQLFHLSGIELLDLLCFRYWTLPMGRCDLPVAFS